MYTVILFTQFGKIEKFNCEVERADEHIVVFTNPEKERVIYSGSYMAIEEA